MKRPDFLRTFVLMALLTLAAPAVGAARSGSHIDSLLQVLDRTIEQRDRYIQAKYHKIHNLKNRLSDPRQSQSPEEVLALNRALTDEYIAFKFDSAYYYASQSILWASLLNDSEVETECRIMLANVLMSGGRFSEALDELNKLNSSTMGRDTKARYYSAYDLTFLHREKYVGGGSQSSADSEIHQRYLDSLRQVITYSPENYRMTSRVYIEDEKPEVAKLYLKRLLQQTSFGTRAYAIVAGSLAYLYEVQPEGDVRKEYLILSAISDILDAVCENESLRELALILFEEGDIKRAHEYISLSISDANFYDAHLRCIEAAVTYPIIQNAYSDMLNRNNRQMKLLAGISITLFLIAVVFGIIFLNHLRTLRAVRTKLTSINNRLAESNDHLSESNELKQKQITQVLVLCSSFIEKLEEQQNRTNHMLAMGKVQQLKELSSSPRMINQEIKEFYAMFDDLVLKTYPDFVAKLNDLLREEERFDISEQGGLCTELRIYALILLGIEDSSKIAHFLRYSNNTVYTYRTKMRNKAIDKAHFEEQVANLKLY